jgi:hypothetical protein
LIPHPSDLDPSSAASIIQRRAYAHSLQIRLSRPSAILTCRQRIPARRCLPHAHLLDVNDSILGRLLILRVCLLC